MYEKKYQADVATVGSNEVLLREKAGRPYQPYTATYDSNHLKHEYLRK